MIYILKPGNAHSQASSIANSSAMARGKTAPAEVFDTCKTCMQGDIELASSGNGHWAYGINPTRRPPGLFDEEQARQKQECFYQDKL